MRAYVPTRYKTQLIELLRFYCMADIIYCRRHETKRGFIITDNKAEVADKRWFIIQWT